MIEKGKAMSRPKPQPTPRAADKCGRSTAISGQRRQPRQERGTGGGFGVWRLYPPIPAFAGNL